MKYIPDKFPYARLGGVIAPLFGGLSAMMCGAAPAAAHAFGARYDLPLPLNFYVFGAGAAVALSFVIMAFAFRAGATGNGAPWVKLRDVEMLNVVLRPAVAVAAKTLSVALFFLVVIAGLVGVEEAANNFAPTFVWIIWWVGLAYVAALIGNIWPAVNPWSIVFAGFERLIRRQGPDNVRTPRLAYPDWLGVWPAVALFFCFAWFELISESARSPGALSVAILIYSAITWLGMAVFGRDVWLARGEAFSLAFEVFGRFAPIGGRRGAFPDMRPRRWRVRPYASALITTDPCRLSATAFILVMLSTVTFDGFKETPLWSGLLQGAAQTRMLHPIIRILHDFGVDFHVVFETVILMVCPAAFLLVFLGFSRLTRWASGDPRPVLEIAGLFVFSLAPIAIAYHLAHYLSYLLIAGQFIIPLISDPFGFGWDLFDTAGYQVDITVIGARFVWYSAVMAIVMGHVIAVGVAHLVALKVFDTARAALFSQIPFLILMVAYTMISLWILSQPIVGSPSLSFLNAPKGALTLAPFEFRERCFELAAGDQVDYEFRSDRRVEFDIHYHDGFSIRYAVKTIAASLGATRFKAEAERMYCLMWFNKNLTAAALNYRAVRQ
ncbi:MAG: hypothetical protein VX741_10690 [Pseudomonadota bacterium]|nr:hypothetical protein [Pseudomonadota bacterium]